MGNNDPSSPGLESSSGSGAEQGRDLIGMSQHGGRKRANGSADYPRKAIQRCTLLPRLPITPNFKNIKPRTSSKAVDYVSKSNFYSRDPRMVSPDLAIAIAFGLISTMIGLLGLLLGYLTLRAMTIEIHNPNPQASLGHEQVLRHEHTHFIALTRPHQR